MKAPLIHQFELGPWDNFLYFVGDAETREVAVVDPAWDADTIFREAEKLDVKITQILCTHSHFDHVDQVENLLKKVDVPVHMLKAEIDFAGFKSENLVANAPGDILTVGKNCEVIMVHTPGHTPGSVCYSLGDSLITGDTLFVDGCGRCDFVGGDPEVMYETLKKLAEKLPQNTKVFPGHNYGPAPSAKISSQRETNPYFQHDSVTGFLSHRMEGKTPNTELPPKPDWKPSSVG